jgi:hypothetical protein
MSLTRAEQLVIAITIPAVAVLTRLAIALAAEAFIAYPFRDELIALSLTIAMFVPFPFAVWAMERAVATGSRSRQLAVLVAFSILGALTSHVWRWVIRPAGPGTFLLAGAVHLLLFAPAVGVFLSLTVCFIAAIHQHRIAVAEDTRRFETEAESVRRGRQAIERQMTPRVVVAALRAIAESAMDDPDGAERLLLRLARHQRLLMQKPPADFEEELRRVGNAISMIRPGIRLVVQGSGSKPDGEARHEFLLRFQQALLTCPPGELRVETTTSADGVTVRFDDSVVTLPWESDRAGRSLTADETSALPSLPFVYPLSVYLIAVIAYDLLGVGWSQQSWNSTIMTLASAVCWLFAGPLLDRAIRATVAFRLPLAIATAAAGVLGSTLAVTAFSVWFTHAFAGVSVRELVEWNVSVLAWRNSLPALVIGANALMTAYFGVMVAARAAAARAANETVRAETRALEDRFHPHFLFNALNSIVAFIRQDRAAAARMCLQLSALVERTVAFAGDRWWAVENELDLIAEYLSIQRIRFGDRLEIDQWDVAPEVRRRPIPRLILQPLLENIFKHAVAGSARPVHAGLTIRRQGPGIEISLWNSIAGLAAPGKPGRGLAFVSGRVRDADGTLTIDRGAAGGRFAIRCYISPPL